MANTLITDWARPLISGAGDSPQADECPGGQPYPGRIAIFTETLPPDINGMANTLRWVLKGLTERGVHVMVIGPKSDRGSLDAMPGVQVVRVPSIPVPAYPEISAGLPWPPMWRRIDEFRPDLVHLFGPAATGIGGLLYARLRRIPVISSFHTDFPAYTHKYRLGALSGLAWQLFRLVHNATSMTLCASEYMARELARRGFHRVEYWSRGVDANQFSPDHRSLKWRQTVGLSRDQVVLLYVGRLAREKRLEDLVEVLRHNPVASLVLVGDGPDRRRLEEKFRGLPARFLGYLTGDRLALAYASADLFVFPSDTETFGNVVLEAMASGLPVVAARAGGAAELLADGGGKLVEPGNVAEFLAQTSAYIADPEVRLRDGDTALEKARQRKWHTQDQLLFHHYVTVFRGARVRTQAVQQLG